MASNSKGFTLIEMMVALLIVAINLLIIGKTVPKAKYTPTYNRAFLFVMVVALMMSIVQVVLGTQVRQEIDVIAEAAHHANRAGWIDQISGIFEFHRTFAILVLMVNGALFYLNRQMQFNQPVMLWMGAILLLEVISGVAMSYFGIPAYLQPTHLVLSSLLFTLQFYLLVDYLRQLRAGMRFSA